MYSVSILIPVYNYDIVALVHNLRMAIDNIPEYVEIILGDDGSSSEYLNRYKAMENGKVKLITVCCNVGRAAIRNRLAEEAIGDFLLFIDADALITGTATEYLRRWLPYIEPGRTICGGTLYPEYPPADPDKMLRWKYGRKREQKNAAERAKHPWASFTGFNFIIDKSIFMKIRFNEELKQYGHEDTLLGYQLRIAGVEILHIDNALVHDGVESNENFIAKTKLGVENLSILCDKVTDKKAFEDSVRLVKAYNRLSQIGVTPFLAQIYIKYRERMEISLDSSKARTIMFSFFKMCLFSTYRAIHKRRKILPIF